MSIDALKIATANRTALVVDDMPFVRRMLAWQLQHVGFARVVTAANGEEALSLMQDEVPDVVFTDYNMPKMDGRTLIGKIRSSETCGKVPVVVVTTETLQEADWDTLGFNGFLKKPYTNDVFVETLGRVISHCA